jgi:hypothetical protein
MEHESFENNEIAKILNDHFVSIKVDREERPDVDRVYMTYLQVDISFDYFISFRVFQRQQKVVVVGHYQFGLLHNYNHFLLVHIFHLLANAGMVVQVLKKFYLN